ncbi:MAG: long-chain-fatty-acid--CoA ligase [Ilumatobacteraceae bacterium]
MGIGNVADIVRTHAAERPDDVAIVLDDRRVTWSELYDRAGRVAGGLAAAGIGARDRVAFLDKNGIEHFEVFFGAALLNAVCVDVNWRLAPPEVAYVVDDTSARVVVVGPDFVPVLDAITGDVPAVTTAVVIGGSGLAGPGRVAYDEWVASFEPFDPRLPTTGSDVAFQLYSSGTTGRPKGVMLSNDNFFALLPAATEMWELDAESVNLVAMPLFHIGGGGWAVAGMVEGATSVIMRELDPAALTRLIPEQGITHAFVVPALLQFLLLVPDAADADYSTLDIIVYGASPISEDVLARSVELLGCKFWQAYGLTETTGAIVHLPPADHDLAGTHRHRLRSCGLPGPAVELRIVDPTTGLDVPTAAGPVAGATRSVGEIWVRGPQIMLGYWHDDEATKAAVDADGWFRTGDAGYVDEDGYVYIHDRVKDMIVSGGENVYPAEVENVLMNHPLVADVAVIGVPHEKWGETPKAIVVKAGDAELTAQDVIAFSRQHLAGYKCPTSVDFVDVLPRNPSGKVLKKDLRAPYWAGRERFVS